MSVWARSDVCYVGISRDHGGCGEGHARPVVQGAPVKVWQLTCHNGCEDYLRGDPLWSSQPTGIPETVDEKALREDVEKRGALEQAQSTADALSSLSKLGDLPAVMAQFMSFLAGSQPAVAAPSMDRLCRNGHRNGASAKFCSECSVSMDEAVPSDRGPELPAGAGHRMSSSQEQELRQALQSMDGDPAFDHQVEVKSPAEGVVPDGLDDLPLADLKAIAERLGVKTTRSKADQIAAIRAAAGGE